MFTSIIEHFTSITLRAWFLFSWLSVSTPASNFFARNQCLMLSFIIFCRSIMFGPQSPCSKANHPPEILYVKTISCAYLLILIRINLLHVIQLIIYLESLILTYMSIKWELCIIVVIMACDYVTWDKCLPVFRNKLLLVTIGKPIVNLNLGSLK